MQMQLAQWCAIYWSCQYSTVPMCYLRQCKHRGHISCRCPETHTYLFIERHENSAVSVEFSSCRNHVVTIGSAVAEISLPDPTHYSFQADLKLVVWENLLFIMVHYSTWWLMECGYNCTWNMSMTDVWQIWFRLLVLSWKRPIKWVFLSLWSCVRLQQRVHMGHVSGWCS